MSIKRLAGLNPTSTKNKKSPYHTNSNAIMNKEHEEQISSHMDSTKYMINSYYIKEDNENDMGAGTDFEPEIPTSFEEQFGLQTAKTSKVRSVTDTFEGVSNLSNLTAKWATFNSDGNDMTLGVHSMNSEEFKNTNINYDTKLRDRSVLDYDDTRNLELFTGDQSFYKPKQEIKPLFNISKSVFTDQAAELLQEEIIRTAVLIGDKQNGTCLPGARRIAPRLDLDENQDTTLSRVDLTRFMPKTIDELRGINKQQQSYTLPVISGKRGSKRAVLGAVEVRRNTLVEENRPSFKTGGVRGHRQNENIRLDMTNRSLSEPVIGPVTGRPMAYDPKTKGEIIKSSKKIYNGIIGIASSVKRSNQDTNNITIYDNQRTFTTQERCGNAGNGLNYGLNISKDMRVKSKQHINMSENGRISRSAGHGTYNYNDQMKTTIKQTTEGIDRSCFLHGHRQNNTGYQDDVRMTIRQTTEGIDRSNFLNGHRQNNTGYQDDVRMTIRQTTEGIDRSNFLNGHRQNNTGYQDDVRMTIRQTTEGVDRSNFLNGYKQNNTGYQDDVRSTIKQTTEGIDRSSFLNGYKQNNTGYQDDVRMTVKQTTEGIDRSNFLNGHRQNTTGLQDEVRGSMRQYTNTQTYEGALHQSNNNGYVTMDKTISVPMQMRQICNNDDYYHNIGASALSTNNFASTNTYNLPITMKQMHMNESLNMLYNNHIMMQDTT